jgi:hypothetical protein
VTLQSRRMVNMRLATIPEALKASVESILTEANGALSEFDLIDQLQKQGTFPDRRVSTDQYFLFTVHFVLFHVLYQFRDELWLAEQGDLEIGPLSIRILPYRSGQGAISAPDPMRTYYLDLSHLETSTDEINNMLGKFWTKFHASDDKQEALSVFSLSEPVSFTDIKLQYRALANIHHPDKGGDIEVFQKVRWAMDVLSGYYCKTA